MEEEGRMKRWQQDLIAWTKVVGVVLQQQQQTPDEEILKY
ncbi:hypothetical protein DFA_07069 [Cavenderia fasciculata]|uniref:Uncharacterized protein n=1 Tax=Cavenderia fasciculata TaxID=261658 RepID=F4PVE4_CACFS|nr:uncharacterized protein DFA_07069 [Cavenderia fasciculata]EGG19958.1 hypothetical protein DFA_07069 [Cavenderia fasciculata]|eukprot:XP_004366941.1 hypothetical protein DFA_07069 [Cavenderia fasciculata]